MGKVTWQTTTVVSQLTTNCHLGMEIGLGGLKADGTKEEDLLLLTPRLAANLTGRAFDAIAEIDRSKLKHKEGFMYLLEYREKSRGKEKVDILGDAFQEFFVKRDCYRKDGEEMADYEPRFRALTAVWRKL